MLYMILDIFFPPREEELIVRSLTKETIDELLDPRLVSHTTPATIALLPFKDLRVRALIHECKYHKNKKACALLSYALSSFLMEFMLDQLEFSGVNFILVPTPTSQERMRERGYNQVRLITTAVARICGIPHNDLVIKRKHTPSQISLEKTARLENQKNAFLARKASSTDTYIVLDDVVTTGATMSAVLEAIQQTGAKMVTPIALAH